MKLIEKIAKGPYGQRLQAQDENWQGRDDLLMKTIEKVAARGGPKHLFGMWKRVFSETARKRPEKVWLRTQAGERFSRPSMRVQPTQDVAGRRAAKATKRELRKLKEKARPFAIPAAAAGAAYLGARAAGSKKEKKGQ